MAEEICILKLECNCSCNFSTLPGLVTPGGIVITGE